MKFVTLSTALLALITTCVLSGSALAQATPDLRVTAIATPGGICNASKVRVTIANSQQAAINDNIPVILTVSQPPNAPTAHTGQLANGIGPTANFGLPVWFHDIPVQAGGGPVTLKAHVNPDLQVDESVYNNNTKITTVNCVSSAPNPKSIVWKLVLLDYLKRPISGAWVKIGGKKGKTNQKGIVLFKGIKPGLHKMRVAKIGCKTIQSRVRVNAKKKGYQIVNLGKRCL